jgi:hypothetical protein
MRRYLPPALFVRLPLPTSVPMRWLLKRFLESLYCYRYKASSFSAAAGKRSFCRFGMDATV